MRNIVLCADDYALHPLVDDAVEALTVQGRLSASSCMVTSPRWKEAALRLPALRPRLSVGLHFNLTEGHGVAPSQAIGQVIAKAYTWRLDDQSLRVQWQQQLDAFEDALGTPPDFIDGHQHVHQLPTVRTALQHELKVRYADRGLPVPWVRSTVPAGPLWRSPKASIIALLGGVTSTRQLRAQGVPQNQGFAGVYGFDAANIEAYDQHMREWLAHMQNGSLMMCHPAAAPVLEDAIGHARALEFAYLRSEALAEALEVFDARVGGLVL